MGWIPRQGPKCPACQKPVYQVEQIIARDRQPYHHWCVRCVNCGLSLSSRTMYEKNEQLFCNLCYQSIFNPQYFATLGTNDRFSQQDLESLRNRQMQENSQQGLINPQFNGQSQQNRHSIASMMQSNDEYSSALIPFPPGMDQPDPNQGKTGFTTSQGIDVCGLTTIAPTNQINAYGI